METWTMIELARDVFLYGGALGGWLMWLLVGHGFAKIRKDRRDGQV